MALDYEALSKAAAVVNIHILLMVMCDVVLSRDVYFFFVARILVRLRVVRSSKDEMLSCWAVCIGETSFRGKGSRGAHLK